MAKKICIVDDCDRESAARGKCRKHYVAELRREKDPLIGTRVAARPTKEPGVCSVEGCEKTVHSKGLCQNHYRQARRAEYVAEHGHRKPGPKPDPSKPRSRHRIKNERHFLELGGVCAEGHELTEESVYQYPRADGTTRVVCKACRLGHQNGKRRFAQYGITEEQYHAMLEAQGGRCKCCDEEFESDGKAAMPHIDHDHSCCPGRRACGECVRGLLCDRCNKMLGASGDDPQILAKGIAYLAA